MVLVSILFDLIGYAIARALLPILSFGKIRAQTLGSSETGFNWLGYKVVDGRITFSSTMAGWIGLLILIVLGVTILFFLQGRIQLPAL